MTRTSSILSLVLAMLAAVVAAVPASASEGYRSADSVLTSGGTQVTTQSGDPGSVKPLFATSGPQSSQASGQRYVDALLRSPGTSSPPSVQVVETRGGEGFHWGDALIGALIASLTLLVMLAAARSVARHRRATAESRA